MKKEKNLESLSDDEILQGFKDADARIVREYYYGYCRVAYCIYDKRYDLQHKPGMDFRRMMSVIINDGHTVHTSFVLESAVSTSESG